MSDDRKQRLVELWCKFHKHKHSLPQEARIKRHVRLISVINNLSQASIGAFTYSCSHIDTAIKRISRYCSIAHSASLGEFEHPADRLTTSAITFGYGMFGEAAIGTDYQTQDFSKDSRFFKRNRDRT